MIRNLLIGLHGHAGVGKDTFAEPFHYYGFRQYALAYPVKEVVCKAFGIPSLYFSDRQLKEEVHPYWNLSPRQMAQLVGTNLFRKELGDDFWIRRLELQLINHFNSPSDMCAIVTDIRFQNEADWIINQGGILIHIKRPEHTGAVGIPNHPSEAELDFSSSKYILGDNYYEVLNTGTLKEFTSQAHQFINFNLKDYLK